MLFKNKTIKAAIFDMDGTMFDTERLRFKTIKQASSELFGQAISDEVLVGSLGLSAKKAEELAKQVYGAQYPYKAIRSHADELELLHVRTHGVPIKRGLYDVLERLKKNHMLMAVATSSRREIAEEYLINANILKYFDITVCGDEVEQGKPHPEIFLRAANGLNCDPEQCLMFEDSENGLKSAAGASGVAILIKDIKELAPDIKQLAFQSYDQMTDFLEDLIQYTPNLPMPKLTEPFPQTMNQLKVGIHGFGAIGGGYLAQIFSHWDGYTRPSEIIAATGNTTLKELINSTGQYHIDYSNLAFEQSIDHVRLIDINDESAVCKMYVDAEIIGLSLPESAFKQQASLIAKGLLQRHQTHLKALTLLVVINKVSGAAFVRKHVQQALMTLTDPDTAQLIVDKTYFSDTVVNRIVTRTSSKDLIKQVKISYYGLESAMSKDQRITTKAAQATLVQSSAPQSPSIANISAKLKTMSSLNQAINSFNIVVFASGSEMALYAQKGSPILDRLRQIQTVDNIKEIQVIKNKLLNGTHAIIAWYSSLLGYQTIGQGMGDSRVLALVQQVVHAEIKPALLQENPALENFVNPFINNFIRRCQGSFKDSCHRVGRDPLRKLQRKERIIGSISLAHRYGLSTTMLEFGAALGLLYAVRLLNPNDKESQHIQALYLKEQSIIPVLTYHDRYDGQRYQSLDPVADAAVIARIAYHFDQLQQHEDYLNWPEQNALSNLTAMAE
jgi:HAD superfamily hydrolase (TIGR01509 family)